MGSKKLLIWGTLRKAKKKKVNCKYILAQPKKLNDSREMAKNLNV